MIGLAILSLSAAAQQPTWGTVVLPPNYDSSKSYPVLIDLDNNLPDRYVNAAFDTIFKLPPDKQVDAIQKFQDVSNGSPERQFAWWLEQMFPNGASKDRAFILAGVSADGIPRDYSTADGFAKMVEGYERRVLSAYAALTSTYRVDTARVFLTGFSIGGDVSWAVALRNPSKIRGAILQSSRASARAQSSAYSALLSGKARFAFAIGDKDEASRIKGARDAAALLKGLKIPSVFCLTPGATHQPAPLSVFSGALGFLLSGQVPAGQAGSCRAP